VVQRLLARRQPERIAEVTVELVRAHRLTREVVELEVVELPGLMETEGGVILVSSAEEEESEEAETLTLAGQEAGQVLTLVEMEIPVEAGMSGQLQPLMDAAAVEAVEDAALTCHNLEAMVAALETMGLVVVVEEAALTGLVLEELVRVESPAW
jgi:hypothetical protein